MEYQFLGASGFKVPVLGFDAGTFGGKGPLFSAWGNTDVDEERLYRVVDVLDEIAAETDKTIPQIALNWLLKRPTVSTVLIDRRTQRGTVGQNLGAVGWNLSAEQTAKLDAASAVTPPYPYYPYWNGQFSERNPALFPHNPARGNTAEISRRRSAGLAMRQALLHNGRSSKSVAPGGPVVDFGLPRTTIRRKP
jgi:aryl-alcohol dehydrogenase-like predicted oxidoreductase